ncbi:N-acetylmuramoyl-L-alanine amidase [Merluccius polli]|uniref:N-acetylmuramoyl-L-alanine amidase n=1 Tax=Merluccius polli TaxID=89951 RepID=A0AA47P615_MERPO|nr:N-acetylmuramoyl-L-alanine amidase [Merluccius polli]
MVQWRLQQPLEDISPSLSHSHLYLPSSALSLAITASSNLIIRVVPLCQWTVTLAGKPLWVRMASTTPPVNAAQFKLLFSLGTEMYRLTRGSFSMMYLSASLPKRDFHTHQDVQQADPYALAHLRQPGLQLGHGVDPALAVLHHLGKQQREGADAHFRFGPSERPLQDGGLAFVSTAHLLIVYWFAPVSTAHLRNMESFISAVEQVEHSNPTLTPLALVRALRRIAGHDDPLTVHYLGASNHLPDNSLTLDQAILNASSFSFFDKAVHHMVTDQGEERGVVLAPDGTTVALAPLLLGIEAGLRARQVEVAGGASTAAGGIFPLTLGRSLGLSFLSLQDFPAAHRLGPDGCWDSVVQPRVFRLSRAPTLATDALINGGMDGAILGTDLSNLSSASQPLQTRLSETLREYYGYVLHKGRGLEEVSGHTSVKRREVSRSLLESLDLQKQVMETLVLVWKLEKTEWIALDNGVEVSVKEGLQAFTHKYWDCPPIIPRCQWGAEEYRSTPVPLSLPLPYLYIHHTYQPYSPCLSFPVCSRDMRAMQRFHQDERGWNDIGYSFVVGSDGYVYEGRGWHHRGTHTRGRNSIGYGVAIIGNYTSTLPSRYSMDLLRHRLVQCAVDGGRLAVNYTLLGHRQVVNYTSCPGDAFFSEISSWEHFGV